jgi:hypothetical protein
MEFTKMVLAFFGINLLYVHFSSEETEKYKHVYLIFKYES